MDGAQFRAAQLRDRRSRGFPWSSFPEASTERLVPRDLGARAFVPKPVDLDRLKARCAGSAAARLVRGKRPVPIPQSLRRLRARHRMLSQRMSEGFSDSTAALQTPRVLVVEDDPEMRHFYAGVLAADGFHARGA